MYCTSMLLPATDRYGFLGFFWGDFTLKMISSDPSGHDGDASVVTSDTDVCSGELVAVCDWLLCF